MGDLIFDWTEKVFGTGLSDELSDTIDDLLNAMDTVMSDKFLASVMTIMVTIACSFMVIYFFQDLMNQASKDMFSFEKLVVGFIRLLIAFCVLLYLKEILGWLVTWAKGFKDIAVDITKTDMEVLHSGIFSGGDAIREEYNSHFNKITKILETFGCFLSLMIPYLISLVCELMGKLIIASTTIMLIARTAFSPIAVVQIFEEGSRSSGARYLKGLFAEAMTYGVILVIIGVANQVSGAWVMEAIDLSPGALDDPANLIKCLSFSTILPMIIPKLAIAGSMASASKIAHDVMGA